jgi:hypothetical protein
VFFLCRVDLLIDGKGLGSRNEFLDNLVNHRTTPRKRQRKN